MTAIATGTPPISQRQSLRLVRLTAVLACLFGAAILSWQFFRFLQVLPGAALLAAALELPLVIVGFVVVRLLRPVRAPDLTWSAAALVWAQPRPRAARCSLIGASSACGPRAPARTSPRTGRRRCRLH